MLGRRALSLSLILSLFALPLIAQTSGRDEEIRNRIRKEGMEHSQIMKTMHMLADVYGPRLTGSPNHKRAAGWTVKQMRLLGCENAYVDPWEFKCPGSLTAGLTA